MFRGFVFRPRDSLIFKAFPKTRRANRRPTSDFCEKKSNCEGFYSWNPRKKMNENYIKQELKNVELLWKLLWKTCGNIMNIFILSYLIIYYPSVKSYSFISCRVHRKCCKKRTENGVRGHKHPRHPHRPLSPPLPSPAK